MPLTTTGATFAVAVPVRVLPSICIGFIVGVPLWAMRHPLVSCGDGLTAQSIYAGGHRFHVTWVNTGANAAKMICLQAARNHANQLFVCPTMGTIRHILPAIDSPVPVYKTCYPQPAGAEVGADTRGNSDTNLIPEAGRQAGIAEEGSGRLVEHRSHPFGVVGSDVQRVAAPI